MKLKDMDILDPELYVSGAPHDRFEQLRREAPVFWHDEPGGRGFWALTKHKDVVAAARDPGTFSSERGGTQIEDLPEGDMRVSPDVMANMDPPRHRRYRTLVSSAFTPKSVEDLKPYVRNLVSDIIDQAMAGGRCDFVADVAARLPATVIMKMVGVPEEDGPQVEKWVWQILTPEDPDFAGSPDDHLAITQKFMGYAHDLAASRRDQPKDDLLSRLMAAKVDGVQLAYEEFGLFFILLLAAGTDTTRHLLANGTLTLIEHADARRRLIADRSLLDGAIEEMLRFCPPLFHFRRTATKDCTVRGQKIAAGDKVVLFWVSANRDEEVFSNPHVFDIDRTPGDHVSFGTGPHFCLGNALARMQVRIAFDELLRRAPDLSLDGAVERLPSNWQNAIKRMPVKFSTH